MYFKNSKLKVLIGLAKGKKNYDKRETIKKISKVSKANPRAPPNPQ